MQIIKFIVVSYFFVGIFAQQFIKGGECECTQVMIEQDCNVLGMCVWDSQLMHCVFQNTLSNKYEQIEKRDQKSYSFYCELYSTEECSNKASCVWYKNTCWFFTGCQAYFKSSHEECQKISKQCISNGFNCISISECNTYINEYSCTYDSNNKLCYWDTNLQKCQQPTHCNHLPSSLIKHNECQEQLQHCTTKDNGGCKDLEYFCNNYNSEISCVINLVKKIDCIWFDGQCFDKICDNAPKYFISDKECQEFMIECTTKLGGGCIKRQKCSDAQVASACIVDREGSPCFWTGLKCVDKFCENAPNHFITNEQCNQISSQCITNGAGCITNYGCESAQLEIACDKFNDNQKCFWNGTQCLLKTCQNASIKLIGDEQCYTYMNICIGIKDGFGCQNNNCSLASNILQTDQECESYFPLHNCIRNKNGGCYEKTSCESIQLEVQCTVDSKNNNCYWNAQTQQCLQLTSCWNIQVEKYCQLDSFQQLCQWIQYNEKKGQCIARSCNSAPLNIKTEYECQQYFQPSDGNICTTKKNGGCIVKGKCTQADVKESCTTDNDGNICFWDNTLLLCRLQSCQDIVGQSFQTCNYQNNNCTIGLNGYCSELQMCETIKNKHYCIYGKDGPCLWINNYQNQNGYIGKCIQYQQCSSVKWKTDQECKQISHYCTSDGYQCVSIDLCENTNVQAGCVTGTNGECIKTIEINNYLNQEKCLLFENCQQANYLTHSECQTANKHCTTDGIYGCIQITQCYNYNNQNSCILDDLGILKDINGKIVSTGKCQWDQILLTCNPQQCNDIQLSNSKLCEETLFKCTSDGFKCIEKQNCFEYQNKNDCIQRQGKEGQCSWNFDNIVNQYKCDIMTCKDILYGYNNAVCSQISNCVSNGQFCIEKQLCESYQNKVSCISGGLNGLCVWNDQIQECYKMKNCESATKDKLLCIQANDRCQWIEETYNQPSQCIEHTCESYYKKFGECQYFSTWDESKCNICKMIQQRCTYFDVQTLSEDECYSFSLNQYYWNPISNKCSQCQKRFETQENGNIDNIQNPILVPSFQHRQVIIILIIMNLLIQ